MNAADIAALLAALPTPPPLSEAAKARICQVVRDQLQQGETMHNAVIIPDELDDADDLITIDLAAMAFRRPQHPPAPSVRMTWGRPSDALDILRAARTPLSAEMLAQRLNTTPKYAYQSAQVLCQRGLVTRTGTARGYLYAPKDC